MSSRQNLSIALCRKSTTQNDLHLQVIENATHPTFHRIKLVEVLKEQGGNENEKSNIISCFVDIYGV